eukprot:NODE_32_length_32166_cov_0.707737.p17 type:complete len:131 gc:universal NODE_32_length_32166_cov_0.707737:32166-31774(-)
MVSLVRAVHGISSISGMHSKSISSTSTKHVECVGCAVGGERAGRSGCGTGVRQGFGRARVRRGPPGWGARDYGALGERGGAAGIRGRATSLGGSWTAARHCRGRPGRGARVQKGPRPGGGARCTGFLLGR